MHTESQLSQSFPCIALNYHVFSLSKHQLSMPAFNRNNSKLPRYSVERKLCLFIYHQFFPRSLLIMERKNLRLYSLCWDIFSLALVPQEVSPPNLSVRCKSLPTVMILHYITAYYCMLLQARQIIINFIK